MKHVDDMQWFWTYLNTIEKDRMGSSLSSQSIGTFERKKLYSGDIINFLRVWDNGQLEVHKKISYSLVGHTFMVVRSEQIPILQIIHQYLTVGECNLKGCLMHKTILLKDGPKPIEIYHFRGHPLVPPELYQSNIRQIANYYDDKDNIKYSNLLQLGKMFLDGPVTTKKCIPISKKEMKRQFQQLDTAWDQRLFTPELREIVGAVICSEFNAFIAQYAIWRSLLYLEQKHGPSEVQNIDVVLEILPFANGAWPKDFEQLPSNYWFKSLIHAEDQIIKF